MTIEQQTVGLMSVAQYAELKNTSPQNVINWIKRGKIDKDNYTKLGKVYIIRPTKQDYED